MLITPLDIQNVEFKVSFRGYNQSEVDSFLNKVLVDYEKLHKENQVIKEGAKRLESDIGKYKNIEENLSSTLMLAQETSNTLKETAEREAASIIQEAELKAKKILEDAQKEVQEKERELQYLTDQFSNYKFKALSFLEAQYRIIKDDAFISMSQDNGLAEVAATSENVVKEQDSVVSEEPAGESNEQPNEQKVD